MLTPLRSTASTPGTTYHARPYAYYDTELIYGPEIEFATLAPTPPVKTDEWIDFNDAAMEVTGLRKWSK